jgi:hypothetical protein
MKLSSYALAAAVTVFIAGAAQAHEVTADRDGMHKRFQEMGRMSEQMPTMRGDQRHDMMHNHMRLMQEQMAGMHGMIGNHGGTTTSKKDGAGANMPGRVGAMEQRMDTMQQMMEQMLRQQDMMLNEDDTS